MRTATGPGQNGPADHAAPARDRAGAPSAPAEAVWALAPAKVNLALHVTGRRADGYHLLDSLVVFADVADRLRVTPGPLGLTVGGPMAAGVPAGEDNLVMRAARLIGVPAAITLEKHLPAAAGIGGGSSDAAAALRALARLAGRGVPDALALGADLPVCLAAPAPQRMRGIGERLDPAPPLPPAWLVLANPGVGVATPAVFAALERRENAPLPKVPPMASATALAGWLAAQRNDLEPPARRICPEVAALIAAIADRPGCLLARMSGSGATCFGLFAAEAEAGAAVAALAAPGRWVAAGRMLTPADRLVEDQRTRATT